MAVHELAGQRADTKPPVDIDALITAYHERAPDLSDPAQRVSFGTSGHRGSAVDGSFNEAHILAITQAIAAWRIRKGVTGPLFIGIDTHALSRPACHTVLEVLATDNLVSIPEVSVAYTQSVIPISAVLFMIAEALVLPDVLREARGVKPAHVTADGLT